MDLITHGSTVVIRLSPIRLCNPGPGPGRSPCRATGGGGSALRMAAGDYAALFRALSLGIPAPGHLTPWNFNPMSEDLSNSQFEEDRR